MYREAASVFRIMLLSAPHDERGYVALGSCHEGLGQEEIALTIYETAIDTAATSALAHVARGRLLLGCDQRELAEEAFDEAERQAELEDNDYARALVALERRGP
jgi:tetratricopeptide (TPR) repeat protein